MKAVLDKEELLNLYNKNLPVEILTKIRNEQKFKNIDELKAQIEKDVKECLK